MANIAAPHEETSHKSCQLLTADAVAECLNVPKSTIYEAARQGRIGGLVRLGRVLRFDPEKFEQWLCTGGQALSGGWRHEEAG